VLKSRDFTGDRGAAVVSEPIQARARTRGKVRREIVAPIAIIRAPAPRRTEREASRREAARRDPHHSRRTAVNHVLKIAFAALVAAPLLASAQEAAKPEEPKTEARAEEAEAGEKGPTIKFSGMVDAYFAAHLNETQTHTSPTAGAGIYSSEPGFNLNFVKITAEAELDRAAIRLDVGLAKEGNAIGSGVPKETAPGTTVVFPTFVQQAYASYKFGAFTLDAGRFVTPAGFEVFESKDNWVYSKGLLFNFAVPTAHEGARVSVPLGALTATAYVANGSDLWTNDIGFTKSPYKTGILNVVFARNATSIAITGLVSKVPESLGTLAPGADVYQGDVVITQGFGPLAVNVSGDYIDLDGSKIFAAAASAKLDVLSNLAIVGRLEYLDDQDGLRTLSANNKLMSYTAGVNLAVGSNAALKGEVRLDTAQDPYFGPVTSLQKSLATVTIGAMAWF
jgi:hypothetical protein